MGSLAPKASELAIVARQEDNSSVSNMMDVSPPEKQADRPVPETNGSAHGSDPNCANKAMDVSAADEASGSREAPSADEPVGDESMHPSKKRRLEGPQVDVSPDAPVSSGPSILIKDPNSNTAPATTSTNDNSSDIHPSIAEIINLEEIPEVEHLETLTLRDMAELESGLQIGETYDYNDDDGWKPDWSGNLLLYEKEIIVNKGYLINQPKAKPVKVKYCDWVASNAPGSNGLRGLELLLRFIYNMEGTPLMAKKVLAYSLQRPADSPEQRLEHIVAATQRVSYDPVVLQQDGWKIKKVDTPEEGEAFHIGRRIMWQRHEAIVIAFTTDETYGGLWKAAYVEDLETFDLEAGELQAAIKRWENKIRQVNKRKSGKPTPTVSGSTRFAATANFTVDGIENGIVLAVPTSRTAMGVMWPARVMHVVEGNLTGNRRNSSKNQIQVVFLAPFWNGQSLSSSDAKDQYSQGPLFEFDNIEVSEYNIQKYPYDTVSMEKVQGSFRFLGLPKAVFSRYLDSHRLAVSLKTYAIKHMDKEHANRSDDQVFASASLTESHALSVRAPIYPQVALTVPFEFILSKLPHPDELTSASMTDTVDDNDIEPTIDIDTIIRSMSPPECFGKNRSLPEQDMSLRTPDNQKKLILSPDPTFTPATKVVSETEGEEFWSIKKFASAFMCGLFEAQSSRNNLIIDGLSCMEKLLTSLIAKLRQQLEVFSLSGVSKQAAELRNILCQCLLIKGHGEDSLEGSSLPPGVSKATVVAEWRKACERIYKRAVEKFSSAGIGNNVTSVITDSRCNGHITRSGSFERPVRVPAALKAAKLAGAGTDPNVPLITQVEDSYMEVAEKIIPKAHKMAYIKRLKAKIAKIQPHETGIPLTEDSDGEGGEDTMGSRGSYAAAVVGVAASIKAADMVVGGSCVNVFCAVRPPGHHAGQELRSMKAISNGFCLFNAAACASLYATTPRSQGGLGLRRVCVIDFDVHHGNGTQDILCPVYDPRFLYISLHAGGAHINGYDDEDSADESFRLKLGGKKQQDGIFPGRCGDTSPHEGVLNIPLGQKVTPAGIGTALVSQVTPAVEAFSPDLIILSAGFDAHINDPLGLGGLAAEDFGRVTEVACQMAYKTCSGRIFSVLEGGYGVPCCEPRDDLFLPNGTEEKFFSLGSDLPTDMKDDLPFTLRQKLERCHNEGFLQCVKEHVKGLVKCNKRK